MKTTALVVGLIGAVVLTARCRPELPDHEYSCDPRAPDSCPPGLVCLPFGLRYRCESTLVDQCGNGQLDPGEQCDVYVGTDGMLNALIPAHACGEYGDRGVVAHCLVDSCTLLCQRCGNHITEQGEACDDGNAVNFDGCSDHCGWEDHCGLCQALAVRGWDLLRFGELDVCQHACRSRHAAANGRACEEAWAALQGCVEALPLASIPAGACAAELAAEQAACPCEGRTAEGLPGDRACGDGTCVPEARWCDGTPDCAGGTDERDCGCDDLDGDGAGQGGGCANGVDCDDWAPGVTGPCQHRNDCPEGWAFIPAGPFEMGCDAGDHGGLCAAEERPRHTVSLPDYCIQLREVTVGEYRACVEAGLCEAPLTALSGYSTWSPEPDGRELHPVNKVSWEAAREYCQRWLGGDLPTEAEWEKAARGDADAHIYPWGDEPPPDCSLANFDVDGAGAGAGCSEAESGPYTWEVGTLTSGDGDSPYGVEDMAGNLMEWVLDAYSEDFYAQCRDGCESPLNKRGTRRGLRGGSYSHLAIELRLTRRKDSQEPALSGPEIGFRCRRRP